MLITLLGSVAAWLVNRLLGSFFPQHPKVTPEVIAQAQKDRADVLEAQRKMAREATQERTEVDNQLAPGGKPDVARVYQHDANERDD